jgi:Tol biopolymer transport system component
MVSLGKTVSSIALVVATALLLAAPAQATSPGQNGKIYFYACDIGCGYDIWAVNADGSGLENVTDVVTDPEGAPEVAYFPSVSADGKVMAFGVDSQATSEIWVMNTDGTGAHQLTNDNLLDQEPAISPDGKRIVWNQWSPYPEYTDRDIWTMNVDGSGQELFFNGSGEDYYPRFTPDGQTVVLASETGDLDVRKVPSVLASPPLTEATAVAADDELLESEPTISPDGSTVAFTQVNKSTSFGPRDIYSVSINGGPTTPLFATSANEISPAYSPDGTKIAFSRDGVAMIGNADGSGTATPLDIGPLNSAGGFDWAPAPEPTLIVDNFGPPPKPPAPKTSLRKHPPKRTTKRLAKFAFGSDEPGSRFECKLDRKRFKSCRSPFKHKVKVGRHVFKVRAVNTEGKRDPTPVVFRWRVVEP